MIPGGKAHRMTEAQMLARKRQTDEHRKAQAILRRRYEAAQAITRIVNANRRAS